MIKRREAVAVELQWHRLHEMKMGKGRRWGAVVFGGEEEEEARRLHDARGGGQNKEWHNGWHIDVEYYQRIVSVDWMRDWAELLTGSVKKIWLRVWDELER
jgi:hypothetical protein